MVITLAARQFSTGRVFYSKNNKLDAKVFPEKAQGSPPRVFHTCRLGVLAAHFLPVISGRA
jgi:hypothetical protein